jgi:predicted dehydrogenase
MSGKLHIGVIGLRFGSDFVPIYQHHPSVGQVSIADNDPGRLAETGDAFGISGRHGSLEELIADPTIDGVHVATPVAFHTSQVLAVLGAGKHCACAVPMATSLDEMDSIVAAQDASGKRYMMMETTVFGREYLYVKGLLDDGRLGEPTFYRGFHMQDLDGFPPYWMGYPPMHYITHAIAPALALTGTTVDSARCLGSGVLTEDRRGDFDNPFPLESGVFRLRHHPMAVDVTMSFFQTAREYIEGFALYGTRMGVEWPAREGGPLRIHTLGEVRTGGRGRAVAVEEVAPPDRADLLPPELAPFTRPFDLPTPAGGVVHVGAAHSGSHPHLVHEWVSSIIEDRVPLVDARTAAAWTAPGVVAHHSALAGGASRDVPDFSVQAKAPH